MNYSKLSKAELLKEISGLKEQNKTLKTKGDEYDKLEQKYKIVVDARKEDKDKIQEAERIISSSKTKDQEMAQFYGQQIGHMKKTLDEQNETIVSLFDMLDNTINLQLNYYQKFKNIFISVQKKEE